MNYSHQLTAIIIAKEAYRKKELTKAQYSKILKKLKSNILTLDANHVETALKKKLNTLCN